MNRTRHQGAEAYPVEQGQVWRVGVHLLACSDTVTDTLIADLAAEHRPDVLYSDPAWDDGQAQTFRTLSGLGGADYRWEDLYAAVLALAPERPHWVVSSHGGAATVARMMQGGHHASWDLTGFTSPNVTCRLHYWSPTQVPTPNEHLAQRKDRSLPVAILALYDGYKGTVIDPCGGLGLTVRAAERQGWKAVTNELSPYRVSAALHHLGRATGETPTRIH